MSIITAQLLTGKSAYLYQFGCTKIPHRWSKMDSLPLEVGSLWCHEKSISRHYQVWLQCLISIWLWKKSRFVFTRPSTKASIQNICVMLRLSPFTGLVCTQLLSNWSYIALPRLWLGVRKAVGPQAAVRVAWLLWRKNEPVNKASTHFWVREGDKEEERKEEGEGVRFFRLAILSQAGKRQGTLAN